jgi:hypothetical protein
MGIQKHHFKKKSDLAPCSFFGLSGPGPPPPPPPPPPQKVVGGPAPTPPPTTGVTDLMFWRPLALPAFSERGPVYLSYPTSYRLPTAWPRGTAVGGRTVALHPTVCCVCLTYYESRSGPVLFAFFQVVVIGDYSIDLNTKNTPGYRKQKNVFMCPAALAQRAQRAQRAKWTGATGAAVPAKS